MAVRFTAGVRTALAEAAATATGTVQRKDPSTDRSGGPAGNARLTAWCGLVLLVVFGIECVTLISLRTMLTAHIVIGVFLVPLVLLKSATTGWRIARYYLGSAAYRSAGPPPLVLRVLGPMVVLTGLAVLGSGLALIPLGPATFSPVLTVAGLGLDALTIHQASFAAWLVVTGLHVLLRTTTAVRLAAGTDTRPHPVPGTLARLGALMTTLVLGAAASAGVLQLSGAWTAGHHGPPARTQHLREQRAAGHHRVR